MSKLLSLPEKRRYLELIIERDGALNCLYCHRRLTVKTVIFEHLDDDNRDNRLDNLAFSCQSCNVKKNYDTKIMDKALCKLEANERGIFVGEKYLQKITSSEPDQNIQVSKEIDINTTNYEITEKYIVDIIETNGLIKYKVALDSCVYLCKKKTGHGSQQSVRNYLASLTSVVAPFEITHDEKNQKIIIKKPDI